MNAGVTSGGRGDRLLSVGWQNLMYGGQALCPGWRSQMAHRDYLLTTN